MFARKFEHMDIESLKKDATQVMEDLTGLSRKLAEIGKSRSEEITQEVKSKLEDDLVRAKERLDVLNHEVQRVAKQMDKSVREKPYLYVLGALGLGAILGKLLFPVRSE